jgi:hypothetical protein
MFIVTSLVGGFVIGRGVGYVLRKYLDDLFLGTASGTELSAALAEIFLANKDREVEPCQSQSPVI